MGGLLFSIQNDISNMDINFIRSFMNLKSRGTGYTEYITEHMKDLNLPINIWIKKRLSKYDIINYKKLYFIYGYHRSILNDDTINGSQPFSDPISHILYKYPELASRPKRKLICNGEIYNYLDLKTYNDFGEKDLFSNSDVEIILPLYIKNSIVNTLESLHGDFAFILTENTDSYKKEDINIYAARDKLGIKPLYYTTDPDGKIIFFISQINHIPKLYEGCTFVEFPIGSYWSFQTNQITKYFDFKDYLDLNYTITTADSDSLETVYYNISTKLQQSVKIRLHNSIGVFLSDGFDSSIIVSIMCKLNTEIVKLFSFGSTTANSFVEFLKLKYPDITFYHYSVSEDFHMEINIINEIKHSICHLSSDTNLVSKAIGIYSLMYLAKKYNVKVILSGEGLNTMFPSTNVSEVQILSVQLLESLHTKSLLIWDRISGMFDIEVRFPWLDINLIDFIMKIKPTLRLPQLINNQNIPKYIVKKSFDGSGLIPSDILWNAPNPFYIDVNEF